MTDVSTRERVREDAGSSVLALEVRGLVKEFRAPGGGKLRAVDGVSFEVRRGEVFGFLGPNGAGKTTTLEMIEGLQEPTAGQSLVLGLDSRRDRTRVKEIIGVQLQAANYFQHLTLEEILDLFGSFYPRRLKPRDLLDKVGLEDKRRALVAELSGGQAQRFSIVASMVNDPEVMFLDEPTTGLDPQARRSLWELVTVLNRQEGKTIVLTTHYMEEAEVLCDRVAIIDQGRIVALDTPRDLIQSLPSAYRIRFGGRQLVGRHPLDADALRSLPGVFDVQSTDEKTPRWQLGVPRPQVTLPALLDWARSQAVELDDLQVIPATLEDVFLSLTGHSLRE